MKTRIELAQYFNELGFKKGVEVGACTGRYSKILLENIPGLQLLSIDSYREFDGQETKRTQDSHYGNMRKAFESLSVYPLAALVCATSLEAASWVADGTLDFVFIDASHRYADVKADINAWSPKVRKGGIVSGHDYYLGRRLTHPIGVIQAVDEYVAEHGYKLQTTEYDPNAFRDDRQEDWWFVK